LISTKIIPHNDTPIIVVASSLGAHVAYRSFGDYHTDIDGLVLNAPAFRPRLEPSNAVVSQVVKLLILLGKSKSFAPEQSKWKPLSEDMSETDNCSNYLPRYNLHDALVVKRPELRMGAATNKWVSEMLKSGTYITQAGYVDKMTIPVHMLFVEDDKIVFTDAPKGECDKNKNCQSEMIRGARHCLLYGPDFAVQKVYDAVDEMVSKLN
jgi:alpha-beta hydrolase superfamily lysophospholipase